VFHLFVMVVVVVIAVMCMCVCEFVYASRQVQAQLRVSPALIRYGAALMLDACLTLFPKSILTAAPGLHALLVIGCFDSHTLTHRVYLHMLHTAAIALFASWVTFF
jgi:hypothetical protein